MVNKINVIFGFGSNFLILIGYKFNDIHMYLIRIHPYTYLNHLFTMIMWMSFSFHIPIRKDLLLLCIGFSESKEDANFKFSSWKFHLNKRIISGDSNGNLADHVLEKWSTGPSK